MNFRETEGIIIDFQFRPIRYKVKLPIPRRYEIINEIFNFKINKKIP